MNQIEIDDYLDLIRGFIEVAKRHPEADWQLFTTLVVGLEGEDKKAVWEGLTPDEREFLKNLKAQFQAQLIAKYLAMIRGAIVKKIDWALFKSLTQGMPPEVKGEVWTELTESEQEWIEMLSCLQVPAFSLKLK